MTSATVAPALSAADAAVVLQLAGHATAFDGVAPLSEQTLLRLEAPATGVRHLLARDSRGLVQGYAQLDGAGSAELVVAPSGRRQGIGRSLLNALERAAPEAALNVWAHGELPGAAALAARTGYVRSRVLWQLRRSLAEPLPDPEWPVGVRVRTFAPGVDEDAWLRVNNAAFGAHPEQGSWTRRDVEQREAKAWFDPAGFFLAERDGQLIGFHWTKVHGDASPPIGEVYVIGVRPEDSGHGLGPALTLVGLHHLRTRGLQQVLLYVDASNKPALKTYQRLGFTRRTSDVLYAPSATTQAPW